MIIRIDKDSDEPVYAQIRAQIVAGIASGELAPDDPLPSVRRLASDLGINLHTVNKAYAILRDEGFVVMRGRAGARVAAAQQASAPERLDAAEAATADALARLATEYRARGGTAEDFVRLAREQAKQAFNERGSVS